MNWKKHFEELKPGDKIILVSNRNSANTYKVGKIYTLNTQYIKNGVWLKYNEGKANGDNTDYWDTKEHPNIGIEEKDFKKV